MTTRTRSFCFLALLVAMVGCLLAPVTAQASVRPEDARGMHRLYNPNSGEHFYTASASERDAVRDAGWIYEGIGWYAPVKGTPIHRLYNPNAGDHHYTINTRERDAMVSLGWIYEGTGWNSDTNEEIAVWREYNPNAIAGAHNFTTSKNEHVHLCTVGWRGEGIAWYGVDPSGVPATGIKSDISGAACPVGQMFDLSPYIHMTPDDTTDTVSYTSSNPGVAMVDANGRVTGVSEGETTITATTKSGKTVEVYIYVPRDGSTVVAGPSAVSPSNWATVWARRATLTQDQATSLLGGRDVTALYGTDCLNVHASVDGRGLALGSSRLSNSLTNDQWAGLAAGTAGVYDVTVTVTGNEGVSATYDTGVTVVPNGTEIVDDNADDPRHTAVVYCASPENPIQTGSEITRQQLLELIQARAWVDGVELADLDSVTLDDGGLAAASAAGEVGYYDVTVTVVAYDATATKTVRVALDAAGTVTYAAASSTAGVAGGTVSPAGAAIASRLTTPTADTATVASTDDGYTFEGWYEGAVQSGSEPTGRFMGSDLELTPELPGGAWPANVTYTAYFRANTNTPYNVNLWVQKLNAEGTSVIGFDHNDTNYERYEDPEDPGEWTGTTGELTDASVMGIEGFKLCDYEQQVIKGDGTTTIDVYYDRELISPTLLPNGKPSTVPVPAQTYYGAIIPNPGNPSDVTGYDFIDWAQDSEGEEVWDFTSATMPAEGVTLYADWNVKTYTVFFDNDEGTGGLESVEVKYGERPEDIQVPTKPGYDFAGYWLVKTVDEEDVYTQYITSDGKWIADYTDTDSVYLTAIWAAKGDTPYEVHHWQQRLNDEGTDIRGTEHNADNYELVGEDTDHKTGVTGDKTAAQTHVYDGFAACAFTQLDIAGDGSTVVDIYYDRIYYTPDLQPNGHSTAPATHATPYGALLTDPGAPPEAVGYEFQEWSVDREESDPWDFATATMPAGGITLWAMWQSDAITKWETIGQMMYERINPTVGGAEVVLPSLPDYVNGTWQIENPEQLAYVAYITNNGLLPEGTTTSIKLLSSLDMTGTKYGASSSTPLEWTPIAGFAGTFDGDGNAISNLRATSTGDAGLIGTLAGATEVRDLKLEKPSVSSDVSAGALVGYCAGNALTISGVDVTDADIFGQGPAGGLVGVADGASLTISTCTLKQPSVAGTLAGGIVGVADNGCATTVSACMVIQPTVEASSFCAGGVLGNSDGSLSITLTGVQQGSVTCLGSMDGEQDTVGGLVGDARGQVSVKDAYATCSLSTVSAAAGLVYAAEGTPVQVSNAYFAGEMEAYEARYAIASGEATCNVCYYDTSLIDACMDQEDPGITGQKASEMKTVSTAFYLNNASFGSPWSQVSSQNGGYPIFGTLADNSPYTIKFDPVRSNMGEAGTASQRIWYGKGGDDIQIPRLDGYTFDGYYSDYDGEGTKYVDENGVWVTPWDKPEGATLHAKWLGNTITYSWPYSWTTQLSKSTLNNDGWTFYNTDEPKVLPSQTDVGITYGVTLVGWKIDGEGDVITELPVGHTGNVRLVAYYVLGPAQNWDQTYFPMRDRVDGYPELPTFDGANGGWQVTNNLELAYVMGAQRRGAMPRGTNANVQLVADIDLTGNETYLSTQGEVTLGGTSSAPLLWIPVPTYSSTMSGLCHDDESIEVVRRITTLKISNSFSSRTGGARFGESYYGTGNATGFFKRLSNASVHDLIIQNPSVGAANTCKAGKTTFSTTGILAGIAEGSTRINRVGIEGGATSISHAKSLHNERIGGMVGTLRGRASMEDVYVRGTSVTTSAKNHNWRYQSSEAAGITVASQGGASVSNAYFQGTARAVTSNVRQNRCGAVLPIKAMVSSNIGGSGAAVNNCFVDTSSSFKGTRADGACARVAPATLKNKTHAYVLNGNSLFDTWETTPWTRDTSTENPANAGYPTFGRLSDESPYTITYDYTGADAGFEGTKTQDVYFKARPANIEVPKRFGYIFTGYWSASGGTGTKYVGDDGAWLSDWNELEPRTLYVRWTKIDNWETIGKAVYDHDPVINAGDPPVYDAEAGGWQVTTPEELAYVRYVNSSNVLPAGTGRNFVILADLDMTGERWGATAASKLKWLPMGNFSGTINGYDHTISNLRMEGGNNYGFLGWSGSINMSNLSFANSIATGGNRVGIVVGRNNGASSYTNVHVKNCTVRASSDGAGGISGGTLVGGGYLFERCSVEGGSVTGSAQYYTGGFVGTLYSSSKPYFQANNCFITASVNGRTKGGFLGQQYNDSKKFNKGATRVTNCYNAGSINGNIIAPFGTVSNCYYDSSKCSGSSNGATARSTAQMTNQVLAYKLNGNKIGGPWTQSDDVNGGYPYFGELTDLPVLTATFVNGDEATPTTGTQTVKYTRTPANIETVPTREGHVFGGYYTGQDGTGTQYVNAEGEWTQAWNLDVHTTFYAKWSPIATYTVRHWQQKVNDDATAVAGTDKTIVEPVEEGEQPTCACYELVSSEQLTGGAGNQTVAAAQEVPGFVGVTPITQKTIADDGSTVVDVFYDRATYDLVLDDDGGSGGSGTVTLTYGVLPQQTGYAVPGRDPGADYSYEFDGYHVAPNCEGSRLIGTTGAVVPDTILTEPWSRTEGLILYAGWVEREGGEGGSGGGDMP